MNQEKPKPWPFCEWEPLERHGRHQCSDGSCTLTDVWLDLKKWNDQPYIDELQSELKAKQNEIDALKLLIATEAPHSRCINFLGCHSLRLDKLCLDCPDFVLENDIIERYKVKVQNEMSLL